MRRRLKKIMLPMLIWHSDLAQNIGADFSLDDGTGYGIVTHDWITKIGGEIIQILMVI